MYWGMKIDNQEISDRIQSFFKFWIVILFKTLDLNINNNNNFAGEYSQFHCYNIDKSCRPCHEVHHSCIGLPDGDNAVSGLTWTSSYITCLLNRTIAENTCEKGVFDPHKRICTTPVVVGK